MRTAPGIRDKFEVRLRNQGAAYHIHHPFNVPLNSGATNPEQIGGWVTNRYYYLTSIPLKDAVNLADRPERAVRRNWVQRILDHDGYADEPDSMESWLCLAEAEGVSREMVGNLAEVVPGVRSPVDAHVYFVRRAPWPESVCSSLTKLFAAESHKQRLATWPQHYPWIDPVGLHYFQSRVNLARRDVQFGLEFSLTHFDTRALQERALDILKLNLDVLWQMNDAMGRRYAVPS